MKALSHMWQISNFKNLKSTPIFWVVLSLTLVITPHIIRFPAWSIVLIIALFIWRLVGTNTTYHPPAKWLLAVISLAVFAGIFFTYGTLFGKTAGSVLLCVLLAIKLHESQTKRDYMVIISLSFFIIVTNFLFSQSIFTVIYMLTSVIVLVMSLISVNQADAKLTLKYKFIFSSRLILQALPLTLILFVLFPRIPGPLWQLPNEQHNAQSGLSDTMSPGNISNLIKSNAVAFRVKFADSIPLQKDLYWRALVLWYFDGKTWEQGKHNPSPIATLYSKRNEVIHYTVTLEPHQKTWLFALDLPSDIPENLIYTNNYNLRSPYKISSLYQYNISSVFNYYSNDDISFWENSAGLKVPINTNPKTLQLGKSLAIKYKNKKDIVNHVLNMFNQQTFHYTLRPPLTPGFDPVDQFLFETKKGFCEHYASSFTLLMRAAGIPARVVMGFQGGTVNPLNQVMSVRNSDAHAWSEVWYEKQGWVRIDPTAAIAPQRIETSLEAALSPSEIRPLHMQINTGFIRNVLFYWDAIDNQWNQWVVGYDDQRQQRLLEELLSEKFSFTNIILLLAISLSLMVLVLLLFIMKPWKKKNIDPVLKAYQLFCLKLAHKGIIRESHEGPLDYASRAILALPADKSSIELITRLYTKLRYEASHSDRQLHQFRQITAAFKVTKL